jgi:glycosyltransferase involved in cell wall biosynthesis
MYRDHTVAVVMPIHNEGSQIEKAIGRVPHFVDLIIAVNDGSTDETSRALSRITDGRLILLEHDRNRGVGAATKTGYIHSLKVGVDLIAVMDGDGQMDGSDLPALLDCALAGADYVKGNRFVKSDSIDCMPRIRYFGNIFFSWLTRKAALFNQYIDAHCGYTVIRRRALARLTLNTLYDRYGFPTEMFFVACREGLVIENVPVRTIYGDEISGINPVTTVPAIFYLIIRSYLRRLFITTETDLQNGAERIEYKFEA